jgi:glyoxylase I family protein
VSETQEEDGMFKRIDHVEIITPDTDRMIEFYSTIRGFRVKERRKLDRPPLSEIVYIELNDTVIELMRVERATHVPVDPWQAGYRMIALEVEDMDDAVQYLKNKGVELAREVVEIGNSKRAEIKDPDGLPIELRQW